MEGKPNRYLVRAWIDHRLVESKVWAFSAEDAKVQVELRIKLGPQQGYVNYVGPVNPDCSCLNQCMCGAMKLS